MANLNELILKVAMLPFHDDGGEVPAKVTPEPLVGRTIFVFESPNKTIRVIHGSISAQNGIIGNLLRHQRTFFS
jgi:hypothetical protein